MKRITVYGIPNCDTIKKTLNWFKQHGMKIEFHDYKKEGVAKEKLADWINKVGMEIILNKRSTTWRELPLTTQQKITSNTAAIKLMIENTSLIKRPVIEIGDKLLVGYDEAALVKQFLH